MAQQVQAGPSSAPVSAALTVNAAITCTVWGGVLLPTNLVTWIPLKQQLHLAKNKFICALQAERGWGWGGGPKGRDSISNCREA